MTTTTTTCMLLHSSALHLRAGDGAVLQQLLHLAVVVAHRLQKLLGLRADLSRRHLKLRKAKAGIEGGLRTSGGATAMPGVWEKRGAGAGCDTPLMSMKALRARACG